MDNYEMEYLMRKVTKYIEERTLNNFLNDVVKNNRHCNHCYFNHSGTCFLAYKCIKNDFTYYDEGD